MKKLVLMLMAVTMMLPMANAQELTKQQAKAVKKEVSKKMKEYKKKGYEIFGTTLTLETKLTQHFTQMWSKGDQVVEVPGFSQAKSRNLALNAAQNSAAARYATSAGQLVKGRVLSDEALNSGDLTAEFDKFYAAFEGKVQQEIKGELRPSFSVAKQNDDGTISVEAYYLVDEDAASRARIRAFEISKNESAAAQKYAQKISDFVNERVVPEQ
ncbi:MAG: hypothetical protein IJ929_03220 [Prevotella sp.]|nr:hypothetical protein [Prevotella sp.]